MAKDAIEDFWRSGYDTLYEAYFYELGSENLIAQWARLDLAAGILTAITASGSAVSGWALWAEPGGKTLWCIVAAIASLAAIVHARLAVPGKIREEERRRQHFAGLRIDLETFMQNLRIGCTPAQAKKEYDSLRKRFRDYVSAAPPDFLFDRPTREAVQARVNDKLRDYTNA
jgi:hypothetical protein